MSAQHPGLHDISPGVFVATQVAAGHPAVAATSASPTIKDAMILLSIALVFSTIRRRSRDAKDGRIGIPRTHSGLKTLPSGMKLACLTRGPEKIKVERNPLFSD